MKLTAIALIVAIGLTTAACDPFGKDKVITISETCEILRAAGVNHNFGFSMSELNAMRIDRKKVLRNILVWFRKNCPE